MKIFMKSNNNTIFYIYKSIREYKSILKKRIKAGKKMFWTSFTFIIFQKSFRYIQFWHFFANLLVRCWLVSIANSGPESRFEIDFDRSLQSIGEPFFYKYLSTVIIKGFFYYYISWVDTVCKGATMTEIKLYNVIINFFEQK